ncbi:MAG: hypothetical protein KIY12_06465 [Thermoplasmata archaeon]|uniref:Uncharacterized protein n=1 Tax=Candidatus Sysuiplasma superficiale TaxID=2823368 RepID=A0A8J7YWW9_9ARCH|nr:hypothetical protein [Candidatus Sysuiplasma superficiale]MBX8644344.1 hypothetical protein [Candidatus Sysuiplasma superficiale]
MKDVGALLSSAKETVERAESEGIVLRLLGGMAVAVLCHDIYQNFPMLARKPHDIDFMGYSKQSRGISKIFSSELGLAPDQRFNALFGNRRLKFYDNSDPGNQLVVDVFLDKFIQSHELPLLKRLGMCKITVTPTDLLFTKLQIWEINEKDILDILSLLVKYSLSEGADPGTIETGRVGELVGNDWGLWKTSMLNIDKTEKFLEGNERFSMVRPQAMPKISQLRALCKDCKKSMAWKMRSLVGEKVQWYEIPEEV